MTGVPVEPPSPDPSFQPAITLHLNHLNQQSAAQGAFRPDHAAPYPYSPQYPGAPPHGGGLGGDYPPPSASQPGSGGGFSRSPSGGGGGARGTSPANEQGQAGEGGGGRRGSPPGGEGATVWDASPLSGAAAEPLLLADEQVMM